MVVHDTKVKNNLFVVHDTPQSPGRIHISLSGTMYRPSLQGSQLLKGDD